MTNIHHQFKAVLSLTWYMTIGISAYTSYAIKSDGTLWHGEIIMED